MHLIYNLVQCAISKHFIFICLFVPCKLKGAFAKTEDMMNCKLIRNWFNYFYPMFLQGCIFLSNVSAGVYISIQCICRGVYCIILRIKPHQLNVKSKFLRPFLNTFYKKNLFISPYISLVFLNSAKKPL